MHWLIALSLVAGVVDLDRDGLDDRLEQRLIERFLPRFSISPTDCALRPTALAPNVVHPTPTEANGTIHGRAFPVDRPGEPGAWVEVQFFHLWGQDCGWNGHPLDVEHVSALLRADSSDAAADAWTARYWYAAAHQDTVCDGSHGARAESLGATDRGAAIWIARGKHASYLAANRCRWGCGSDRCPDSTPLDSAAAINIGERAAPMNGASWVDWAGWPLGVRMRSDFPPDVIARIDRAAPGQIVAVHSVGAYMKSFLLGTGAATWGLVRGQHEARRTLGATMRVMGRAIKATGRLVIAR